MALTEPQISNLLGYVAEPTQNKLSVKASLQLQDVFSAFREVQTQKERQLLCDAINARKDYLQSLKRSKRAYLQEYLDEYTVLLLKRDILELEVEVQEYVSLTQKLLESERHGSESV